MVMVAQLWEHTKPTEVYTVISVEKTSAFENPNCLSSQISTCFKIPWRAYENTNCWAACQNWGRGKFPGDADGCGSGDLALRTKVLDHSEYQCDTNT